MKERKLLDKPIPALGLVFSKVDGFAEHESTEVLYKYSFDDTTDEEAVQDAGYVRQDVDAFGWALFENEKSKFRYLLAVGTDANAPASDPIPYGISFIFLRDRADLMECLIRISPVVSAQALHNLMCGYWGPTHAPGGFSFYAAWRELLGKK